MKENYILGLSMNCDSYPSIFPLSVSSEKECRLGIAHYALHTFHASVLNNLKFQDKEAFDKTLYFGKKNGSVLFLCSYSEVDSEKDSYGQNLCRKSFANRDWVIACSGQLNQSIKQHLILEKNSFIPIGKGVEELILCWILQHIHQKNSSSLEEFSQEELYRLLHIINGFGNIDILLSDGHHLVAYHDKKGIGSLYMVKSFPPHKETLFTFEKMGIQIEEHDRSHSIILFTNQKIGGREHISFKPGQMLVVRQTEIFYDSDLEQVSQQGKEIESPITEEEDAELEGIEDVEKNRGLCKDSKVLSQIVTLPLAAKGEEKENVLSVLNCIHSYNKNEKAVLYSISHSSVYEYESPVYLSRHLFRLQPIHNLRQTVLKYELKNSVEGKCFNFQGVFGNSSTLFDVTEPYKKMSLTSESIVAVNEDISQSFDLLYQQMSVPLIWMPWDRIMLQAYLVPPELPTSQLYELSEYAMSFVKGNNYKLMNIVNDINNTIYREYKYVSGSTTFSTTAYDVFYNRQGVCQDFANLFICLARLINIPARYRVGYIYTGKKYSEAHSDATHAWVELYFPNIGWLGFDPTNGCLETVDHIKVACGRNYLDATPTSGTIYKGGGKEKFHVSVCVTKLGEQDIRGLLSL